MVEVWTESSFVAVPMFGMLRAALFRDRDRWQEVHALHACLGRVLRATRAVLELPCTCNADMEGRTCDSAFCHTLGQFSSANLSVGMFTGSL
jgi:hypothetical protein